MSQPTSVEKKGGARGGWGEKGGAIEREKVRRAWSTKGRGDIERCRICGRSWLANTKSTKLAPLLLGKQVNPLNSGLQGRPFRIKKCVIHRAVKGVSHILKGLISSS